MKRYYFVLLRKCVVLSLVLVCASSGLSQDSGIIEGTVFAVSGRNLVNTLVIACSIENNLCSQSKSKDVPVQGTGSSATFQVFGLEPAQYMVFAWRDLNGNGETDAGDELAVYARNGSVHLVTPPDSKLELYMRDFNGDPNTLLTQDQFGSSGVKPNANSSVADASSLVGVWSTTGATPVELVNAKGIRDSSAGSYSFESDGRYSYAGMLETYGPVFSLKTIIYDEGTYTVKGDVLTLQYRRRLRSWNNTTLQSDKTSSGTETYRWSIRPTSSNDGKLALYLLDQDGTMLEYPKR
jgi:hypothetical protein